MTNLIFAIAGLIIVILVIFMVTSKYKPANDTIIPSPVDVQSPKLNFALPDSTTSSTQVPFPILKKEEISGKKVKLETDKGDIGIELFDDIPVASSNFLYLVGKHFYDGLIFHRVIRGFMIQGGDPKGDGTGGPGYAFVDEPSNRNYKRGIVAMANAGPNTNGSQFFIMQQDNQLPRNYTIFGQVISGLDTVDAIANSQVGTNDRLLQPTVIKKATLE